MSFQLSDFTASPSQELLDLTKKSDLLDIAELYGLLNVKKTMLKHEIKNILIQFFVDGEIFYSSVTSQILVTQTEREERIRLETVEREETMHREKLEHEKLRLEMEEREREKERERQERIEIEKEKLDFQIKMKELELQEKTKPKILPLDTSKTFDVTKHIQLVPPFQEKEVDKYFLHFEKVAENLKWPKEHWTLLLQSVVIGKAREIYTQLSLEQSSDYDKVKELILKAYELVPEAYRQKFRDCRKEHDQTHVEFARTKEQLFDRWCSSKKVGSDTMNWFLNSVLD